MYAVRVVTGADAGADEDLREVASRLARDLMQERAAEARAADGGRGFADEIGFSAGNPRVEHLTGVVHLYRRIPAGTDVERVSPNLEVWQSTEAHLERLSCLPVNKHPYLANFSRITDVVGKKTSLPW